MIQQNISIQQTAQIMSQLATLWIEKHDSEYFIHKNKQEVYDAINYLFRILYHVLMNLECCAPADIFVPMLIYADKYVQKYGINHCQLFNLLLTSMIVTMKFWDDTSNISNAAIAKTFNYKLQDVNLMEKWFLSGLEYKLSMTDEEVDRFIVHWAHLHHSHHNSISSLHHRNHHNVLTSF
eukprot:TRINITY_DN8634_c0_g1_i1.p1 TRINITY_DN8634_c0_g1~~TRINITY_DN8634_c0_g1_i1.p1  ORF type:complete len:180 (-),score=22.10 TRINITY_DN8634_c0_g1_i1:209-748(-)